MALIYSNMRDSPGDFISPEGILITCPMLATVLLQFLGASELVVKQYFLRLKHFIIINDLNLTNISKGVQ